MTETPRAGAWSGGSATGSIHEENDQDAFRVKLKAGTRYRIDLEGSATNRGTLADPYISTIKAP